MRTHRLHLRIYYEDTDAAGMVYHARYLAFAERGRAELLRDAGVPHDELVRDEGLIFVVRRIKIDYLRPARLDDVLTVTTEPIELGAALAVLRQDFAVGEREGGADGRATGLRAGDGRPSLAHTVALARGVRGGSQWVTRRRRHCRPGGTCRS